MTDTTTCPHCRRHPCRCADLKRGYTIGGGGVKKPVTRTLRPDPALRDPALPDLKHPDGTVVPVPAACTHPHLVCRDCGAPVDRLVSTYDEHGTQWWFVPQDEENPQWTPEQLAEIREDANYGTVLEPNRIPPLVEHGRTDDVHPANLRPSTESED